MNKSHLIVVDSSVLPEVILKVLQVKKIMANKEAKSSAAAYCWCNHTMTEIGADDRLVNLPACSNPLRVCYRPF